MYDYFNLNKLILLFLKIKVLLRNIKMQNMEKKL